MPTMVDRTMVSNSEGLRARIKLIEDSVGKNQKVFARKSDISYSGYRKIMEGKTKNIQIRTIQSIADKHAVSMKWLIYGEGEMKSKDENIKRLEFVIVKNEDSKTCDEFESIQGERRELIEKIIKILLQKNVVELKILAAMFDDSGDVDSGVWFDMMNAARKVAEISRQH